MINTETLISIMGWAGAFCILGAFALSSYEILRPTSKRYQWLNLIGGIFLIINSAYNGNYPFTFINTVWAIVAIVSLIKAFRRTSPT